MSNIHTPTRAAVRQGARLPSFSLQHTAFLNAAARHREAAKHRQPVQHASVWHMPQSIVACKTCRHLAQLAKHWWLQAACTHLAEHEAGTAPWGTGQPDVQRPARRSV
jgi:hypothetical protein